MRTTSNTWAATCHDFREGYRAQAADTVKSQLVIDKIIREENIKAEDAEIEAKIAEFAEKANKPLEEYKKDVDDSQREYIANDIVINKLFDFLKENNNLAADAEEKPAKKPAAKKTAAKKADDAEAAAEEKPAKKPATKKAAAKKDDAAAEEKPARSLRRRRRPKRRKTKRSNFTLFTKISLRCDFP